MAIAVANTGAMGATALWWRTPEDVARVVSQLVSETAGNFYGIENSLRVKCSFALSFRFGFAIGDEATGRRVAREVLVVLDRRTDPELGK